jgi:AraC family ethanolamine operon transcriptional activator
MSTKESHLVQLSTANVISSDIDELTGWMGDWDSDWRQLETGRPHNRIEVIAGQHTVIQQVHLSHSIHQQGKAPSHLMTFGFPANQSVKSWDGREIPCPAMFDFNGTSGYDAVTRRDFFGVTVSFSKVNILRIAERLKLPATQLIGSNLPHLLTGENYPLEEFRQYLYGLCDSLPKAKAPNEHRRATAELDEELPIRLLTALAESKLEPHNLPLKVRQKGLRLAIDFIEANCQDQPSIPDICTATGLSWRSLDRAFKECLGIGPKRYLLNLRLAQARRQLKSAPPRTKVVDIANDWGFWHMGDFAREYRKMFGESPAESIRQ